MNTFDTISDKYKEKSLVQQKAALKLIELLKISGNDDVIDIACGPGHITNLLRKITRGRVTGVDTSEGMVKQAKAMYPEIDFRHVAVENLDYSDEFDIAFCNSALQWFSEPDIAIKNIFDSLKKSGKLGLACPATSNWTPFLDRIISRVAAYKEIEPVFSHWKNPWFHLPAKNDYRLFFEKHGFITIFLEIEYEQTDYSIEEAFNIYLSGAANGYTGKKYYDIAVGDDYISAFNNFVKEEIRKQSKSGRIKVDFNRLYYIGKKQV
ncbi:MAG: methyltransferase domain-containing protein [Candidatus Methanoperedens sp.]|nr:methyltransferase domain-containing protein [Candidatus Methanoperedens sp.]